MCDNNICDNKTPFDFVIYHRNCPDGFVSAWVVWTIRKDKAFYHSAQPNDKFVNGYENKHVLMVDVTYLSDSLMDSIRQKAKSLTIIDHHPHALIHFDVAMLCIDPKLPQHNSQSMWLFYNKERRAEH